MKKTVVLILGIMLIAAAFTGCKKKEVDVNEVSEQEAIGMENPWHVASTAEEAAEGAGVGTFSVPEGVEISLGTVKVLSFRYMDTVAQADCPIGAVDMTIRKGKPDHEIAEGDISGDYNTYQYEWTEKIGSREVKCFGNRKGEATKTFWAENGFDYVILAFGSGGDMDFGLSADDLKILVENIN